MDLFCVVLQGFALVARVNLTALTSAPRRVPLSARTRVNRPSSMCPPHEFSSPGGSPSTMTRVKPRPQFYSGFTVSGDAQKVAPVSLRQAREKPPENRDSRKKSNASRVGGGVIHIHAYSHSVLAMIRS